MVILVRPEQAARRTLVLAGAVISILGDTMR